jgi:hypothetical protein
MIHNSAAVVRNQSNKATKRQSDKATKQQIGVSVRLAAGLAPPQSVQSGDARVLL